MTTFWSSIESRGSSMSTIGSGSGEYSARCFGFIGSLMSIAWKPPECQVLNAMFWVSVGLCAENEVRGRGSKTLHMNASFWISLNSERTTGLASLETSMKRAQPHGQPWPAAVAVPYTSSDTYTQFGLFQSRIALCPPGPGHFGRSAFCVMRRYCGFGLPEVKSETSATAKSPSSSAKYARVPSLETDIECRPVPDPE